MTRTLIILAYDELAGLGQMWLSNDPLMLDGVVTMPYTSTVTWVFDEREVAWVQVADSAGNISEPYPVWQFARPLPSPSDSEIYLPVVVRDYP